MKLFVLKENENQLNMFFFNAFAFHKSIVRVLSEDNFNNNTVMFIYTCKCKLKLQLVKL